MLFEAIYMDYLWSSYFSIIESSPMQVAEAAGLKHVALPEFENVDGR